MSIPYPISGTVTNPDGSNVENANVYAFNTRNDTEIPTTTNSSGQYVLDLANLSEDYQNRDIIHVRVLIGGPERYANSYHYVDTSTGSATVDFTLQISYEKFKKGERITDRVVQESTFEPSALGRRTVLVDKDGDYIDLLNSFGPVDAHYVLTQSNATLTNEHLITALDSDIISDADGTRSIGSTTNKYDSLWFNQFGASFAPVTDGDLDIGSNTKGLQHVFIKGGISSVTAQDGFHIKRGDGTLIFAIGTGTGTAMYFGPSNDNEAYFGRSAAYATGSYINTMNTKLVRHEATTAPGSPANGDVYYDSGSNILYGRINGAWVDLALGSANALLDGTAHTDTAAGAVVRGDVIIGDATPEWSRLAKGGANEVLTSDGTDVAWAAVSTANHTHDKHTDTTREIFISAGEMHADSSTPPVWSRLTALRVDGWEHDFLAAKNVQCNMRIDADFVSGVVFHVYWVQIDAPAGSPENWVCVQDAATITPDTDTYDSPAGELNTETISAEQTSGILYKTQLTNGLTVSASNEILAIRLGRDPANVADNYTSSIWIVGLGVEYTRSF